MKRICAKCFRKRKKSDKNKHGNVKIVAKKKKKLSLIEKNDDWWKLPGTGGSGVGW